MLHLFNIITNFIFFKILEDLIWRSLDVLRIFEQMKTELEKQELPADANAAKQALEEHNKMRKRIIKAPVEELEREGQQVCFIYTVVILKEFLVK